MDTFSQCVQEAIQENQEQGRQRITKFEETHLLVGPALPPFPALGAHPPPLTTPDPWLLSLFPAIAAIMPGP